MKIRKRFIRWTFDERRETFVLRRWKKHLLNVSNLTANSLYKVSVFTERILNSVASTLQNFHETLYIMRDKSSENV